MAENQMPTAPTQRSPAGEITFIIDGLPLDIEDQTLILGGKRHQDDFGGSPYSGYARIQRYSDDSDSAKARAKRQAYELAGIETAVETAFNVAMCKTPAKLAVPFTVGVGASTAAKRFLDVSERY